MGYKRDKVDEPTAGQYNSKLMKFGCDHGDVIGSEVSKIYWIKQGRKIINIRIDFWIQQRLVQLDIT